MDGGDDAAISRGSDFWDPQLQHSVRQVRRSHRRAERDGACPSRKLIAHVGGAECAARLASSGCECKCPSRQLLCCFLGEGTTRDLDGMADVAVGKTNNRRVLGSLNDFVRLAEAFLVDTTSLLDVSLRLADAPCSPLAMESPRQATVRAFGIGSVRILRFFAVACRR